MKDKLYIAKENGTDEYKVYTEKELRDLLKSFELDYIKSKIQDLYCISKYCITKALFDELAEIKEWDLNYYDTIDYMNILKVIKLLREYDVTIYQCTSI